MNLSGADIYTDFSGFSKLRGQARQGEAGAGKAVAEKMEAMFVSLMLKSMREAGAAFGNTTGGMERDLYDSQLALGLAHSGRLGLAGTLERAMVPGARAQGQDAPAATVPVTGFPAPTRNPALPARDWVAIREAAGPREPAPTAAAARSAEEPAPGEPPAGWTSPESFASALWPAASRAAEALGTRPEAVLAVAALETGWGRHMPLKPDGTSSNNLFGIKAHGWDGEVTRHTTLEFEQGAFARRVEPFRVYDSPQAAVKDFARFIASNPRYQEALASGGDPVKFVHALQRAGYATDPRYGEKLEALLGSEPLRQAAASVSTSNSTA